MMDKNLLWSRLPGFYAQPIDKRREQLLSLPLRMDKGDFLAVDEGLSLNDAELISENVVASFGLPLAVAANFVIDGEPVLVPMVTEEPSIVAGASKMAKIVGDAGGFKTAVENPLMKGQIQLYHILDVDRAVDQFQRHKLSLLDYAQSLCPSLVKRGGGVVSLDIRVLTTRMGPMIIVEPLVNVVDAMGANIVNSLVEHLAPKVKELMGGEIGLKILTNLSDKRLAHASCHIPIKALALDPSKDNGHEIAERMVMAHVFAESDPYRAATHNKGIMNGVDAVGLATGNDTRALDAGAHAYASCHGYRPLTTFIYDGDARVLRAEITLPCAVGVVGGISKMHKGVKLSHKILGPWAQSSTKLASVMAAVGLAQCLAAITALCQEGIQKGHMKLHHKKSTSNISGKN